VLNFAPPNNKSVYFNYFACEYFHSLGIQNNCNKYHWFIFETVRHVFFPINFNSNPILFLVVWCMLGADVDGSIVAVLSLKKSPHLN
jgi:hypothetical protein